MKKLVVSTIILLPLILLAVMLVSGAILSLVTHIYVESVEFVRNDELVLVMDDEQLPPTEQLAVNVFPLKAKNRDLIYSSENEEVVSIDKDGVVKAIYYGEAYIKVSSRENKAAVDTLKVIVTDTRVHKLEMQPYETEMYRGEKQMLHYKVYPAEANGDVTWTSSDPSILSVSPLGDVVCNGKGDVTITATSVDRPEIVATAKISCHVQLTDVDTAVHSVTTAKQSFDFPELVVTPSNATYSVTFSSSDEKIAAVDSEGHISVKSAGVVTITATAADGRNNVKTTSVTYHCTDGYYVGSLFEHNSYTFDYDKWAGKPLDEIVLSRTPESSYRKIIEVTVSEPDLISFDRESEKFILSNVADDKPLGTVSVSIKAEKYDLKTDRLIEVEDDKCTITLWRNVSSLSFISGGEEVGDKSIHSSSISLSAKDGRGGLGVRALPFNHTNDLIFSEDSPIASIDGTTLTFFEEGTAVVTVSAKRDGILIQTATVSVTYTQPKGEEKPIEVGGEDGDKTEQSLSLQVNENDTKDTGLLYFSTPEGTVPEVVSEDEEVVRIDVDEEGTVRLVPLQGGFTTVTVNFVPKETPARETRRATAASANSVTLHIYVDKAVTSENIIFDKKNGFTISRESIDYTLTLNVTKDVMEGKQLLVDGVPVVLEEQDGKFVYHGNTQFSTLSSFAEVEYSIEYTEEVAQYDPEKTGMILSGTRTFRTTHGNLTEAPKVSYDGQVFSEKEGSENTVRISDIGEQAVITVDASSPTPADFELGQDKVIVKHPQQDRCFVEDISVEGFVATVTLTATEGGEEDFTLTVAGIEYEIHASVSSLADTLTVQYENTQLLEEKAYKSFLGKLDYYVVATRQDGKDITERNVTWTATGGISATEEAAANGVELKDVAVPESGNVTFTCGKAAFTLNIVRASLGEMPLSYHLEYSVNGVIQRSGSFDVTAEEQTIEYSLPKAIDSAAFGICIEGLDLDESFLGGIDNELMQAFFRVTGEDGAAWEATMNATAAKIDVKFPGEEYFSAKELVFACGDDPAARSFVTLVLTRIKLDRLTFTGFDSENKANGGDVFKGYQQVRVFAKHSDYAENKTSAPVDYIKMPVNALSSTATGETVALGLLKWTFTGYQGNEPTDFTLTQTGTTVRFGGEVYTIEPGENGTPSTLRQGDSIIAEGGVYTGSTLVPWVDVYAESSCAHIYFGGFKGLSETDVQNDYFGNFDERTDYVAKPQEVDDGSGRDFAVSEETSYTFLRVEAGDGALGGVNAHFNFNVLADDELYNVFNATGYYAHNKLVLHEDLYGLGELDDDAAFAQKAEENDLYLTKSDGAKNTTDTNVLGKSVIYGNGYQINLQAKNELIKQNNLKRNDNYGVQFGALYNLNLKGSNPEKDEVINTARQQMIWMAQYAYYCDIQLYSKGRPLGNAYVKNSVLHTASFCAFQLHEKDEHAYFENVVVVDCATGITCENSKVSGPEYWHFKGFFDVLNYKSLRGILTMASDAVNEQTLGLLEMLAINDIVTYYEWFGGSYKAADIGTYLMPYINLVVYTSTNKGSYNFWDEEKQQYINYGNTSGVVGENVPMKLALDLTQYSSLIGGSQVTAWTYDYRGGTYYNPGADGRGPGQTNGTQDLSKLFTEERYIRLLCEYKTSSKDFKTLEKNEDHILWHMQQVHRDMTIIRKGYDKTDPELGVEPDHITALRDSLKGVKWPDGSGVNNDGNVFDASGVVVLARLLSDTALPGKED